MLHLTKPVLEAALEGEMDSYIWLTANHSHLAYGKHKPVGRDGGNPRDRQQPEAVGDRGRSDLVAMAVPRNRDGSFTPEIVAKRQRRLCGVDDLMIPLTAKGLTIREQYVPRSGWPGFRPAGGLSSRRARDSITGLPNAVGSARPLAVSHMGLTTGPGQM